MIGALYKQNVLIQENGLEVRITQSQQEILPEDTRPCSRIMHAPSNPSRLASGFARSYTVVCQEEDQQTQRAYLFQTQSEGAVSSLSSSEAICCNACLGNLSTNSSGAIKRV